MKRTIGLVFILIIIVFYFTDCKRHSSRIGESDNKAVVRSHFAQNYPFFDPQALKTIMQYRVVNDSLLSTVYANREYNLLWLKDTLNTGHLNLFIDILAKSVEHGLPENYFGESFLTSLIDSIETGRFKDSVELYSRLVNLEYLSARAIVRYTKGMNYGFVKPGRLYKKDFAIKVHAADSVFYNRLYTDISADPVQAMLNSVPQDSIYLAVMQEYRTLLEHKDWNFDEIQETGGINYKSGAKNQNITAIAKRLAITGEYIPVISKDNTIADSLDNSSENTEEQELTPELLAAINVFRQKNSLPINEKEVGDATIRALNRSLDYYKIKLRANLERYRWRRIKQPADRHIEVNVAAFLLFATEKGKEPLVMKVCAGKPTSKTPMLESNISYINLNPKWNVPVNIAKNEISLLQKKDPTYLQRHNMKLYKAGTEIDHNSIDWLAVNPAKFDYSIIQEPGGGNSLGRLKFMFNNEFSVYLHDTPLKSAFNRLNRAVSHGCIRVQQPLDLAYFLTSADDLYKDRIRYSIGYDPETEDGIKALKADKLKKLPDIIIMDKNKKITLFIDYFTVYKHPVDNKLYYADDVYEYDAAILEHLNRIPI